MFYDTTALVSDNNILRPIHFSTHILLIYFIQQISEAQQIALESSDQLLPPEDLTRRVETDLKAIRARYNEVSAVYTGKYTPGELLISNVDKATLDAIDASIYGPIEVKPIFQDTIFSVTFSKPYNPQKLSKILKDEFDVSSAEPNNIYGGSSNTVLKADTQSGTNTYTFEKGSGDCPSGCIYRHIWIFTVGSDENVVLVKESGDASGGDLATVK